LILKTLELIKTGVNLYPQSVEITNSWVQLVEEGSLRYGFWALYRCVFPCLGSGMIGLFWRLYLQCICNFHVVEIVKGHAWATKFKEPYSGFISNLLVISFDQ
jgi:hypothetical protein